MRAKAKVSPKEKQNNFSPGMSYMDEEAEAALVVATEAEAEAAEDVP